MDMNNEEKRMDDPTLVPDLGTDLPSQQNLPQDAAPNPAEETPAEFAAPQEGEAGAVPVPEDGAPLTESEVPPEAEPAEVLDFFQIPESEPAEEPEEQKEPTVRLNGEEITVAALLADLREVTAADDGLHLISTEGEEPSSKRAPAEEHESGKPTEPSPLDDSAVKIDAEEYLINTPAYMGLEGNMPKKKRRRRHAHFIYYLAEALRGMRAHGFMSFAAVGVITACLLLMGCFAMVVLNINSTLNNLMDRNEFLAYVDESYSQEEAEALQSTIEAVDNVSTVQFITREEAKATYIEGLEDDDLYADLPDSIFRDRFSVHVDDLDQLEDTINQVEALDGIAKVSAELKVAKGFVAVRNVAVMVAAILVLILFVISLFIMSNTIKLATINRGDEIAIMRMCGATNRFIRWPFIYEGAILGLLGAGISYGLLRGLYYLVTETLNLSVKSTLITVVPFEQVNTLVLAVFLGAGLVIGIGGSSGTIRRFLKV